MKRGQKPRIINLTSLAHMMGEIHFDNINLSNGAFGTVKAYFQSKLAIILFTRELARRLGPNSNINTYCLHPGIIDSEVFREMPFQPLIKFLIKFLFLSVEMGSQTILFCALEESLDNETGQYYK